MRQTMRAGSKQASKQEGVGESLKLYGDDRNTIMMGHTDSEAIIKAQLIWKCADAVCFDVDSTVCQDEILDEFAKFVGLYQQIQQITAQAMNGKLRFRDSLRRRLDILRPTRVSLQVFIENRRPLLTPGILALVNALRQRNVAIYLVTGGFLPLVLPVAEALGVPETNIFANVIWFDANGCYAGFDTEQLTSDSGTKQSGKAGVCALLKAKHGYRNLVMIGDGATDLEASPPADLFIGFGGNECRDYVKQNAAWFVTDFDILTKCLN